MDREKAKEFIRKNARPIELAEFKCHFENGTGAALIEALAVYQNPDGGFGRGLEPDNWNPNSTPIATNDAIKRLFEVGALKEAGELTEGIIRYLTSGDSFDRERQRWLFAIDSNKNHPHAIWWERNDDDIPGWNPTVSLAAFLVCMEAPGPWREMVREAFEDLEQTEEKIEDGLKCYILAWNLLKSYGVKGVIEFEDARAAIQTAISRDMCQEVEKYGVEYVPTPSWLFQERSPFLYDGVHPLIRAELRALDKLQMEDGGFDISWKWYTPYSEEFEQARAWWRPKVTMEKLRFYEQFSGDV